MKTAHIPPDGNWHDLPEKPVRSIIAPTYGAEADIVADGTGRVRNYGHAAVEVEYEVEHRCPNHRSQP